MLRGPSHYGYADDVNRRARLGILTLVALSAGAAFGFGALGTEPEPPQPTVLALIAAPSTTTAETPAPPTTQARPPSFAVVAPTPPLDPSTPERVTNTAGTTTTSTTTPPPPTTSTTQAPTTTTTARPTTTSTRPTTTTTIRPTTTTTRPKPTTTTTTTLPPTTTTTTTTTLPPTTTTTSTTTTTTTLPPTTTTTVVVEEDTAHIHRLNGRQRGGNEPYVRFEARIRNEDNRNVRDAVVSAVISNMGDVSATTNSRGWARFDTDEFPEGTAVTITITGISHPDYVYAPEDNVAGPSLTVTID